MIISKFESLSAIVERLKKSKHFQFGMPFAIFVAGCFYYLNHVQSIKYEFRPTGKVTLQDLKALGYSVNEDVKNKTLEDYYADIKNKNINDWENKRIPRPWEE